MRTIMIAIGIGATLLASGLAVASTAPHAANVDAAQVSSDTDAHSFTVAQRSRSSGGSPYNSFDNSSGGWMNGGNTG